MTNKDRYKKAFEPLHASGDLSVEVLEMKDNHKKKKYVLRPAAAIAAAAVIICSSFGVCYAADVGGFRQTLRAWFGGKQVNVTATKDTDGVGYTFSVDGENGDTAVMGAGGVSIDADGNETELSAAEVLDSMSVDAEQKDDGSVWLYYYDQSYDITSLLKGNACHVCLKGKDGQMMYFDIEGNGDGGFGFTSYTGTPDGEYSADEYTRLDQ